MSTDAHEHVFQLDDVSVVYGTHAAVSKVDLAVHARQITAFIGPSGCGKTSILRSLNRLNDLVPGARVEGLVSYRGTDVYADGVDANDLRRRVGMVFQKPNVFPSSIYDNVAYGPRLHRLKGSLDDRVEAALMVVLSLAILATLTVIGVTLVAAMLVIPAVIARMLTDSFGRMLAYSTVIGTLCGLIGMYLSYYAGVPSGTMIVLVGAALFIVVLAATGGRGLRRSSGLDSHSEDLLAEKAA